MCERWFYQAVSACVFVCLYSSLAIFTFVLSKPSIPASGITAHAAAHKAIILVTIGDKKLLLTSYNCTRLAVGEQHSIVMEDYHATLLLRTQYPAVMVESGIHVDRSITDYYRRESNDVVVVIVD